MEGLRLLVSISFLVFMVLDSSEARSHHHRSHTHHHSATGSAYNNNAAGGNTGLRSREESGSLPFTENRFTAPDANFIQQQQQQQQAFPGFSETHTESFQPPPPLMNFQPIRQPSKTQQQPAENINRASSSSSHAATEKGGKAKKDWGNHSIPFAKELMSEIDDGKIRHHDYPALTWFLNYFAEQYPEITRLYSIGKFLHYVIYHQFAVISYVLLWLNKSRQVVPYFPTINI